MNFCVLGSGSKGNSTYVASGNSALLIDAGFSGVEIERRLAMIGVDPASLNAILLTHEHSDHIQGVGILSRKYRLPVFANRETLAAGGKILARLAEFRELVSGEPFRLHDLLIHPFSVSHDAADPLGFVLSDHAHALGYCTDTGMISRLVRHRLAGCHGLVLECNHDPEILKNGHYPPSLKQRVRSQTGHLANADAIQLLRDLWHEGLQHVVLAHISDSNNRPEIIREMIAENFSTTMESGTERFYLKITLAAQNEVGEMVVLGKAAE